MALEVFDAVLTLPFVRLWLAQDLRAATLGASEVRVDVVDVHDEAIDDVWIFEPLARERARLRVAARTLVRVARMTHEHRCSVELEHDVGDGAQAVMKSLSLTEAEYLCDPIGGEARIFIREHRDDALLCHGRPPSCSSSNDALARPEN